MSSRASAKRQRSGSEGSSRRSSWLAMSSHKVPRHCRSFYEPAFVNPPGHTGACHNTSARATVRHRWFARFFPVLPVGRTRPAVPVAAAEWSLPSVGRGRERPHRLPSIRAGAVVVRAPDVLFARERRGGSVSARDPISGTGRHAAPELRRALAPLSNCDGNCDGNCDYALSRAPSGTAPVSR